MFRKILTAVGFTLLFAVSASAQKGYFGTRVSFDITSPAGSDLGLRNGSGFSVGAIYNYRFNNHVYLEPGVSVYYNTMGIRPVDHDGELYDGSVSNWGVEIPLNVGYNFALLDNLEVSVFTGPVFDFNITAKGVLDPNFTGPALTASDNLLDNGWKRFDCQWGFGLGVTFAHSYYIGISGGIGISPLASYNIGGDTYRMRRNSFSIALGYNF